MAGKITALKYQKKDRRRVSVYLDGRFAFGLPEIVAAGLRPGQFLSDAEITSIQDKGIVEKAFNQALDYLSYRPRSRSEVVTYLQKRELSEHQIETISHRLERAGLIDDEAFARFWVENRERFRPRGTRALRYELRGKGVSHEVIDRALKDLDTTNSAYRAAARKARQLGHLDRQTFNQKLVAYLARRGFEYDVARDVTARHWQELQAEERDSSGF